MPNAKVLEEKKALVASLVDKIKNSPAGVLVDYKGINVEDDTKLRRDLRNAGVDYAVVKNTMLRFAADELGLNAFDEHLNGTTALAVSTTDDVVAPAKILADYAKKHENFKIKIGFLEGEAIDASEVRLQFPDYPAGYRARQYREKNRGRRSARLLPCGRQDCGPGRRRCC